MAVSVKAKQQLEHDRTERLKKMGEAIRHARGDLTQTELGELLEPYLGEALLQTNISRWEMGIVSINCEQLRAIELALNMPTGSLFVSAGYVPADVKNVEAVLRTDPGIDEAFRDIAVSTYRTWVKNSSVVRSQRRGRRQ